MAHEGEPYGHLADAHGPLTEKYMAARCVLTPAQFRTALKELRSHDRLQTTDTGLLFIRRMVRDEEIRQKRQEAGKQGGNPALKQEVNQVAKGDAKAPLRASARALPSDCLTSDSESQENGESVKGVPPDAIEQIGRWLYEFMGEQWPEPSPLICEQIYIAANGAPIEQIGRFLQQLHRQGRKPDKSWPWFIGVVRDHFAGGKHGYKAAV